MKLDGLGVVLVESNSVALVRALFQPADDREGMDELEKFQKQKMILVGK